MVFPLSIHGQAPPQVIGSIVPDSLLWSTKKVRILELAYVAGIRPIRWLYDIINTQRLFMEPSISSMPPMRAALMSLSDSIFGTEGAKSAGKV
jgi:hypothetical protein